MSQQKNNDTFLVGAPPAAEDPVLTKLVADYLACKVTFAAQLVEGEQVDKLPGEAVTGGVGDIINDLVMTKLLPELLDKYGEQLIRRLVDVVMNYFLTKLQDAVKP